MNLYALAGCGLSFPDTTGDTDSLVKPYLQKLYSGEWDMNRLIPEIYVHNVQLLLSAYEEGYGKDFFAPDWTVKDNNLLTRVQNNIFAFSGAKTYAEMQELRDAVYENGNILPFNEYRRRALDINAQYNVQYLDVERMQVVASATQGSRWLDIEETAGEFPYLEYVTARDGRVREGHRRLDGLIFRYDDPYYRQYYPPNGWGPCRCSTRKLTEREYLHQKKQYENRHGAMPDSDEAQRIAGQVVAKPFRQNVGTSEVFMRDGHPYFKSNADAKEMQLSAVKNYGLKPVKDIYNSDRRLSRYKGEIKNGSNYREYWKVLENHHGTEGNGFRLIDKRNQIAATFDNTLKEKLLEKGRFDYFDEAIETFTHPDEVWGTFKGGKNRNFKEEYFNVYMKYYEDKPIVLLVNRDGRVDSFYKLNTIEQAEQFRVGLLKKKR